MNFSKVNFYRILAIVVGTFLMALSTNGIFVPNQLVSGGASGIALFLYFLFGLNISMVVILINIPLFLIAFFHLQRKFLYYSLFGMCMLSFWLEVTKDFVITTNSDLSVVVVAGLLTGIGTGIIFRNQASTGGIDIIAKLTNKYLSFSMGTVSLVVNASIIFLSLFKFGIDRTVLTLTTLFITSRVINFVVEGTKYRRTVSIITSAKYYQLIADDIINEIQRGVTIIPAMGAYTNDKKYMLYTTVNLREIAKIRQIVKRHDSSSFVTISETAQVIGQGRGFGDLNEE